jgi:hypothetical protein
LLPQRLTPLSLENPKSTAEIIHKLKQLPVIKTLMASLPGKFSGYMDNYTNPHLFEPDADEVRLPNLDDSDSTYAESDDEADYFDPEPDEEETD